VMSRRYCLQSKLLVVSLFLFLAGCGNEFRPVAIPIIPPGGTPQALRHAIVLTDSSSGGNSTNIDVSGDTIFAVRDVGVEPVHAALTTNLARVFIANNDDTLSTYLTFSNQVAGPVTTITLPAGSNPRFVHTREVPNIYVALESHPSCTEGAVGVVSTTTLTVNNAICVGVDPVAMAQLPNLSKLYVVNKTSGTVTVINTADGSIATEIAVDSMPSAIDVSADGAFVYVANTGGNSVSAINATTDAVTRIMTGIGTSPNFLRFDSSRKRVYVTNEGQAGVPGSLSIIEADPDPAKIAEFHTAVEVSVGVSPRSVTALANNTKVYVANSGSDSVSVLDAATKTVTATIAVGDNPLSIQSSGDSAKVLVANQGAPGNSGSVSVIRTSDDAKILDIPLQLPAPPGGGQPVPVNPRFLLITN
jgi:YVTN family beta-propeller protein